MPVSWHAVSSSAYRHCSCVVSQLRPPCVHIGVCLHVQQGHDPDSRSYAWRSFMVCSLAPGVVTSLPRLDATAATMCPACRDSCGHCDSLWGPHWRPAVRTGGAGQHLQPSSGLAGDQHSFALCACALQALGWQVPPLMRLVGVLVSPRTDHTDLQRDHCTDVHAYMYASGWQVSSCVPGMQASSMSQRTCGLGLRYLSS